MSEGLLEIRGLGVRFGGVAALSDVDLSVARGSIHGLIGPNGAGKTTLLNCISRLVQPTAGTMRFDGADLVREAPHGIAALGIARTFQNFGLIDHLTVLENVMAGRHARHPGGLLDELLIPWRRNAQERAERAAAVDALRTAGLEAMGAQVVSSLPYGTRKSVELARAASLGPKLLMLDEPTAGLTHRDMNELRDRLLALRERTGMTMLVITHHIEFLLGVADRVTVLDLGQCIAAGHPSLVKEDPRVIAAYVGTQDEEDAHVAP
jgi:branched-chain amino acid transport system ATP-binding protein